MSDGITEAYRSVKSETYRPDKSGYAIKDSGKREEFQSGMVRDTATGKMRPDLIKDGPMYQRWINHLTKGAVKYVARNWMKASGISEYDRFMESTDRHYHIWYTWRKYGINVEDPENPTTEPLKEDHAAAVFFNINGVEYVQEKLGSGFPALPPGSVVELSNQWRAA